FGLPSFRSYLLGYDADQVLHECGEVRIDTAGASLVVLFGLVVPSKFRLLDLFGHCSKREHSQGHRSRRRWNRHRLRFVASLTHGHQEIRDLTMHRLRVKNDQCPRVWVRSDSTEPTVVIPGCGLT